MEKFVMERKSYGNPVVGELCCMQQNYNSGQCWSFRFDSSCQNRFASTLVCS